VTSGRTMDWSGWANQPLGGRFLFKEWRNLLLNLVDGLNGGKKGPGISPNPPRQHMIMSHDRNPEHNHRSRVVGAVTTTGHTTVPQDQGLFNVSVGRGVIPLGHGHMASHETRVGANKPGAEPNEKGPARKARGHMAVI
jgi:hypothetical protein